MTTAVHTERATALAATEDDRHFIRTLFADSLTPYYNGDHLAHADRVLDSHLAPGDDRYGHFSKTQSTFVLWAGDGAQARRLGVLNMVTKRQGTVKISPLILTPDQRNRSGMGSALLAVAEDFARGHGARQLYCTVAASNTAALGFFLRHGFLMAGSAPNQYKPGINEYMLYKELVRPGHDPAAEAADVTVRMIRPEDTAGLRDLLLRTMPQDYQGVDEHWVAALLAGHERRHQADVNQKFKVIHVAVDALGTVRGVAAAGPKKGEPVKLMPLCADSPAVLAKLLDTLPGLFRGLGRKLYTHLPPDPATTAVMQSRGWQLEALMPAAYHPDSCTAQWGLPLTPLPGPLPGLTGAIDV
jgi:ribosomal protein S18 acetylase RimI-like enzyme